MQNQHTSLALPPPAIHGALQPDRLTELLHILFWNMTVYGQARKAKMLTNVLSSIKPLIVKVQKKILLEILFWNVIHLPRYSTLPMKQVPTIT